MTLHKDHHHWHSILLAAQVNLGWYTQLSEQKLKIKAPQGKSGILTSQHILIMFKRNLYIFINDSLKRNQTVDKLLMRGVSTRHQ